MNQEPSFMEVIDTFDKLLKKDLSEEIRAYCEAMKKIFIGVEQINANINRITRKINNEKEIIN
jgi:hypothetical protein